MAKVKAADPDTEKPNFRDMPDKPTGAKISDDGSAINVPTTDLPGTDHPETAKPQEGIKGMGPVSETGTQSESEPHQGQSYRK